MCVCGNPKAFTHLFILFLLPLHPRIISFPTVYRNRHNHCTFLPSEKRQPPLRLQFSSVTRKSTCNPPSITFILLSDANSPKALMPAVQGFILKFLPSSKPAFPGCFSPYLDFFSAQSRGTCPCAADSSVAVPTRSTPCYPCLWGVLTSLSLLTLALSTQDRATAVFASWFAGLCFHFDIESVFSKVHCALYYLSSYHFIVICRQLTKYPVLAPEHQLESATVLLLTQNSIILMI